MTTTRPAPYFFSLKWRAVVLFSLLLLAINSFFMFYFSNSLSDQFELERKSSHERRIKELNAMVRQAADKLLTLADIVPSLSGMETAMLAEDAGNVAQAFSAHWLSLQLGSSVDMAQIYSSRDDLIQSWKAEKVELPNPDLIHRYVQQVNKTEHPMTFLDCTNKCTQFAASPMLAKDRNFGVIVLGTSLAPGVVSFQESSGVDIGILNVAIREQMAAGQEAKYIGPWHAIVSALTGLERNLPLLKFAASGNVALGHVPVTMRKTFNGREFELDLFPVKQFSGNGDAYFVAIDDITRRAAQIREVNRRNLIFGIVGLILSESLLLLILWRPLSRLRRTADVLPMLARNAFEQIRQSVGKQDRNTWVKDEFDMLDDTLVSVSRQLESLQAEVAKRTTDLREANEQLMHLNEDLRRGARQLLAAQQELVLKEKLAVLGQVAGSVGHELRNPLGVMNNAVFYLQHTMASDPDGKTRKHLNIIKNEIAASERIVADLLDSVRTTPPRVKAVGVAQVIEQTLSKCSIPQSVMVGVDIPDDLQPLHVDPLHVQQVFRNLISNAVEAMPEGGALEIRAVEDEAQTNINISVRDTGIGISPEQMSKLFQPLFTTKARGIGLGLVVVKNLTQANGGKVEVQSEMGKGTVFAVTLPSGSLSAPGA